GITRVLRVQLPVVWQHLDKAPNDLDLPATEHTIEASQHLGADEVLDRRRVVGKRAEHEAVHHGDTQLTRAVILYLEPGCHPALALHTALKGDRAQVATQVVAPGVVYALEIPGAAAGVVGADQGAAMRAAVLERSDRPVGIARDHDRHLPDDRCSP